MPKRSSKQKDTQQPARSILDAVAPDAEPPKKKPVQFFRPESWAWLFDVAGYTGDYEFIYFEPPAATRAA